MHQPSVVFLKLSGEMFQSDRGSGPSACIDPERVHGFGAAIDEVVRSGRVRLGVAIGGGNIYRGRQHGYPLDRPTTPYAGDHMGLLATVINGVALKDVLVNRFGVRAQLFSPLVTDEVAETFLVRRIDEYWESYDVLIFTGTGAPAVGLTTDSVAADTAVQLGARLLLKATKVDGVFDADPTSTPQARFHPRLNLAQAIESGLEFMDREALYRCLRHRVTVRVFHLDPQKPSVLAVACDRSADLGSILTPEN